MTIEQLALLVVVCGFICGIIEGIENHFEGR